VKGVETLWGVADAVDALARLEALGGTILSLVASVGGGIKTATITDPFGNQFGIIENPDFDIGKCS
jgi:predicted enzyme related to lactoylglutathione lyase